MRATSSSAYKALAVAAVAIAFAALIFWRAESEGAAHNRAASPDRADKHATESHPESGLQERIVPAQDVQRAAAADTAIARVVRQDGAPQSGADVQVWVEGELFAQGISGEDGIFSVRATPGTVALLHARLGPLVGWATREQPDDEQGASSVIQMASKDQAPTDVELVESGRLRGRVVHEISRSPFADVLVFALDPSALISFSDEWLSKDPPPSVGIRGRADGNGLFDLHGLDPGKEYKLIAFGRGHLSERVTSVSSGPGVAEAQEIELAVLPVFGAAVWLVDGADGGILPPTVSQLARVRADLPGSPAPGEVMTAIVPEVAHGPFAGPPHFTFARRISSTDLSPKMASLGGTLAGFVPFSSVVELALLDAPVSPTLMPLSSGPVPLQDLVIRFEGYFESPSAGSMAPAGDLVVAGAEGRPLTLMVAPGEDETVRLRLPMGRYEISFTCGAGLIHLPGPGPEQYSIAVLGTEPFELRWRWPADGCVLWLDPRDVRGRPRAGMLDLYYAPEAGVSIPTSGIEGFSTKGLRSVLLTKPPYAISGMNPGRYWIWEGSPGPRSGHLVEVGPHPSVLRLNRRR